MSDQAVIEEARVEQVQLGKGEEKDYIELVEEAQQPRSSKRLKLAQVPKILLPYQAAWHQDKSVVRFCVKSRRIGFSWGSIAAEGALEAARNNGMDQYYMGFNLGMAAENIGDAAFFARAYNLAAGAISVKKERHVLRNEATDIIKYKIKFSSGHVYEALSSSPHNWRGRQGHARIDEAAFHNNLREVIKGALAFRLWGGRIDIVSTENGEDNYFHELEKEIKAGKLPWSFHKIDFDKALAEGFYKRICLVTGVEWSKKAEVQFKADAYADYPDQEDANEELGCIPKKGSGAYFSRILIERCAEEGIPILNFTKPTSWVTNDNRIEETDIWIQDVLKPVIDNMPTDQRTVFGQDYGRSGDLSFGWPLQQESPTQWRTPFLLELRNIPFDVQYHIISYILNSVPLFHHAKFDARGNGQAHAEAALQEFGANKVECVMLSQKWYSEHFPKYKSAYEDKSIIVPKSEDVIADHRRVILVKGNPKMDDGRDKGSDGKQRHGDSAVAGLLSWAATLQEGQPPAGETIESVNDEVYAPNSMNGRRRVTMFRKSV